MNSYTPVEVVVQTDECGQTVPRKIVYSDKVFPIKRILHICQPEDMVVRYTVLIEKEQRHLFYNGQSWRIYGAV